MIAWGFPSTIWGHPERGPLPSTAACSKARRSSWQRGGTRDGDEATGRHGEINDGGDQPTNQQLWGNNQQPINQ